MASQKLGLDNLDLSEASCDLLLDVGRQDVRIVRSHRFLSAVQRATPY